MSYAIVLVLLVLGTVFTGVFSLLFGIQTKSRMYTPQRSAWRSAFATAFLLSGFIIFTLMLLDFLGVPFK
ncbi:MAG: hypothetical protein ABWY20_02390 [Mycobacterium sp.]